MTDDKPYLWIIDSDRRPLAETLDAFNGWSDILYVGPGQVEPEWEQPPDAIFFSAEIAGGATGAAFAELHREAGNVPLLAVTRLRSLAQAVSFFRAGAVDYLSLPLDEDDARERVEAALEKAARQAVQGLLMEIETVDRDPGEISLTLHPAVAEEEEEDILAKLGEDAGGLSGEESPADADPEDEPVPVDGLPIPTLWEELPCGLLVFDSSGNLVFCNSLGLELFGASATAELEDALENGLAGFDARSANHKPLPDNQWPQILALKTRTARSAVVSVLKPDRRRVWLRIDCLPHLVDGRINRLTMTLVNLTGELPPLTATPADETASGPGKRGKTKPRGKRRK